MFHYVSSVKGKLVTRYPSLQMSAAQYIGAVRKGKNIEWDENEVVAISEQEWQKYRREYRRCVSDNALKERTNQDFEKYVADKIARDEQFMKEKAEAKAQAEAEANQPASNS